MKKMVLLLLFVCAGFSCDDEIYSNIPNTEVNLLLDLDFKDRNLVANQAYEVIIGPTPERPAHALDRFGYGGILVINGQGVEVINLFAYDLSCPVEAERNVRVAPNNTNTRDSDVPVALTATCPKCGAVYNIYNGLGNPQSGTKFYLRSYRVMKESGGRQYRVIN
ncbi:MAG: hypothetical protein LBU22_12255 [Dysgonamonadaceae bacterium]|jgi:hypothetical protein|nr:hypothetical protein [Dysgonamonadaceae bacterium]